MGREVLEEPRATRVWGVLNVTPDSFSDGGEYTDVEVATQRARQMHAEGASVIDIGGASSRPAGATYGAGAARVSVTDEIRRVVPVVAAVSAAGLTVSIDTTHAEVARAALDAGARIVNDVSGGSSEALLELVAERDAKLVLMHSRREGRIDRETTHYPRFPGDVVDELVAMASRAQEKGIAASNLLLDPGIGFAKTASQNARLLGDLDAFVGTGYPILVGASRKSFIAQVTETRGGEVAPPGRRLGGSIAAVTMATLARCAAVRVHDVFESAQAVALVQAAALADLSGAATR